MNTFANFSLEVVLQIIQHLDMYALMAFLEAYPLYKRHAVLVTDHRDRPMFFNIEGIERRDLVTGFTELNFPPSKTPYIEDSAFTRTHPIRMFEFGHTLQMSKIVQLYPGQDVAKPKQSPNLNIPTTFVFLNMHYYGDIHALQALTQRLDEFTACKWHAGLPTDATTLSQVMTRGVNGFSTLSSLRLDNMPLIKDASFPALKKLTLIYTSREIGVPVVEHLIARNLQQMVVHYIGEVPIFKNMSEVASHRFNSQESFYIFDLISASKEYRTDECVDLEKRFRPEFAPALVFELAHIVSVGMGVPKMASSTESNSSLHEKCDFKFINRFAAVNLYGVPEEIIHLMSLEKVPILRLQCSGCFSTKALRLYRLKTLILILPYDNLRVPHMHTRELDRLWVMSMGQNPSLGSGLADSGFGDSSKLVTISIYNSPRLSKSPALALGQPEITPEGWQKLGKSVKEMYELTIIGIWARFLTRESRHVERTTVNRAKKVCLRPLLKLPGDGAWSPNAIDWIGEEPDWLLEILGRPEVEDRVWVIVSPILAMPPPDQRGGLALRVILGTPTELSKRRWFVYAEELRLSCSGLVSSVQIQDTFQPPIEAPSASEKVMGYQWKRYKDSFTFTRH